MDEASLLWGLLFGSVGLGYWMYGRKQKVLVPWLSGLGLMIFPYFVSSSWALVLIGVLLCTLPFVIKY